MSKFLLLLVLPLLTLKLSHPQGSNLKPHTSYLKPVFRVQDFGAVADGKTINTKSIQAAIDTCSATGGKVLISGGTYLTGTLFLKNNVALEIADGSILKGSSSFADYPLNDVQYKNSFSHSFQGKVTTSRALIFAEDVQNISLTGKGSINGSGDSKEFDLGDDGSSAQSRQRPCMLLIIHCKNIKVQDLFLTNSGYWMQNYIGCDGILLKGLKIYNHTNYNQDGMDIDSRNVLVEDCEIDVDDDGICFKNHERKNIVENVVIRNCKIATNCNAIKFGTASIGGLKKISISHCQISKASIDNIRHWQQHLKFIEQPVTVISGIALEAVDGAIVDDVVISDINMEDVQTPIFLVLGNRARNPVGDSTKRSGQIKNVTLKNITATAHSKMTSSITGFPGNYVENLHLENIVFNDMGKGTLEEANAVFPENPKAYPENRMYGQAYPASGLYIRHAKNITINNIKLGVRNEDHRPAITLDDVSATTISGLQTEAPAGNTAAVRIIRSTGISIVHPTYSTVSSPLVEIAGGTEKDVEVKNFLKYKGWVIVSSVN